MLEGRARHRDPRYTRALSDEANPAGIERFTWRQMRAGKAFGIRAGGFADLVANCEAITMVGRGRGPGCSLIASACLRGLEGRSLPRFQLVPLPFAHATEAHHLIYLAALFGIALNS